jgi:hypothetical protein
MFASILSGLLFAVLSPLVLSTPIESRSPNTVASSHNIYLVTCTWSGSNGRWGNSDKSATGVAFFKAPIQTPPSLGGRQDWKDSPRPDQVAILRSPATSWEGTKRQSTVWENKAFSANIVTGAGTLSKGQIAGEASLGSEQFVCFKDGETEIRLVGDGDGNGPGRWGGGRRPPEKRQRWNGGNDWAQCKVDYWCASLG